MKKFFRATLFFGISLLLIACRKSAAAIPSPLPSSTAMPTFTPIPSQTVTATIEPTPRPEFVPPTLIPTIDPTLVPGLLSKAFSFQTIEGVSGHPLRRITGWDAGFGTSAWWVYCPGYVWLDSNHLLLYPVTGQESPPEGIWSGINVIPQPVVINLEAESVWLPPVNTSSVRTCNPVFWSRDLGILINSGIHDGELAVFAHTFDGQMLAYYPGSFSAVSPSRRRILIGDNQIIDLQTNKSITLDWSLENYQEQMLSEVFWTSDETRLYQCCYFYADLRTGTSHQFDRSDFQDTHGNHLDSSGLWFYRGEWVRNDTYFQVEWSWIDDGDIRYLPLIDLDKKIFYDVREMAGISEDWTCYQTAVSPDGQYVWMVGGDGSYLVNLFTFESQFYPGGEYLNAEWSPNSKFLWLYSSSADEEYILSVAENLIKPFPVTPSQESAHWWHPNENIVLYGTPDKNSLVVLDASTMSFRELPFSFHKMPFYQFSQLSWSANGEKFALIAEDGSVWQVDYPNVESSEQLTPPLPAAADSVQWSPDGNSIAFISASDIYIVEVTK